MLDLQTQVRQLKRPGLLVRAARFGVDDYRRSRDLPRLLGGRVMSGVGATLMALLEAEREVEIARKDHAAGYALATHIELLAAIMAEARDFEAITRPRLVE